MLTVVGNQETKKLTLRVSGLAYGCEQAGQRKRSPSLLTVTPASLHVGTWDFLWCLRAFMVENFCGHFAHLSMVVERMIGLLVEADAFYISGGDYITVSINNDRSGICRS